MSNEKSPAPEATQSAPATSRWYCTRDAAAESLVQYVAKDIAHKSGLSLEEMSESARRVTVIHAEAAVSAMTSWLATNAPDAVAPLREAGFTLWTPEDAFGPITTPGRPRAN